MSRIADPELLNGAILASEMSVSGFAIDVLDVDARKVNGWLTGQRPMPAAIRALCMLIMERPALAQELAKARQPSGEP